MVCIPCIVIPFCLWIFHRFIRPFIMKFWDPWKKVTNTTTPVATQPKDGAGTCSTSCTSNTTDKGGSTEKLLTNGTLDTTTPKIPVGGSQVKHAEEVVVSDKKRD